MGEEYFIQKAECDSEFVFAFAKAMKIKNFANMSISIYYKGFRCAFDHKVV